MFNGRGAQGKLRSSTSFSVTSLDAVGAPTAGRHYLMISRLTVFRAASAPSRTKIS
jgi:hypothetical protein